MLTTASVAARRKDTERAITLLAGVDRLGDATGKLKVLRPKPYAELEALARPHLSEQVYCDLIALGKRMSTEELVDMALATVAPAPPETKSHRKTAGTRGPLSDRERAVLRFVAEGMSNKQIASRLSITPVR